MLIYLLATNSIDIIVGNFNYDLLKVSENKLLDIFTHHIQMVNKPAWKSFPLMYQLKTFTIDSQMIP